MIVNSERDLIIDAPELIDTKATVTNCGFSMSDTSRGVICYKLNERLNSARLVSAWDKINSWSRVNASLLPEYAPPFFLSHAGCDNRGEVLCWFAMFCKYLHYMSIPYGCLQ